ncbi:tail protein X [Paenibacillus sp. GCM10027626]|uniref:tail protein X n=1 Tax=Paenibacillus sp. GCM10027626 TaxID=3273411 RepID=UPI003643145F
MGEYVTIQGDTWDGISYKLYGDASQMTALMDLNPAHIRTVFFSSGVLLKTPDVQPQPAADLPPWKAGE